jgi:Ca2+-binding RTX toxin-like protein
MATVTFTGDASASNGTSLQVLDYMAILAGAAFDGDADEGNRLSILTASNDSWGATYQEAALNMVTTEDDREIVTGLTGVAGSSGGFKTIVSITGLRLNADFDNLDIFSAGNFAEHQRVVAWALAGDDNFFVSGAVSSLWGDFQSAPLEGKTRMGDDIFVLSGVTAVDGSVTIYGDARIVNLGTTVKAGDDILNAGTTLNVACTFYGDFEIADGTVTTYGNDELYGGAAADVLYGDAELSAEAGGNDYLVGNAGNDQIFGGGGNDRIKGGHGADAMDGGAGIDTVNYKSSSSSGALMVADLADAAQNTNDAAGDTYAGIEVLIGRNVSFVDDLRGDGENNRIFGLAGADLLSGRDGQDRLFGGLDADRLDGGAGSDTLIGGAGADIFVFSTTLDVSDNVDKIADFKPADDTIELSRAIMSALPDIDGPLPASAFFASKSGAAHDADDRILYEKDTGRLFYDADGDGDGEAILFARLQGRPGVTAADFEIG